MTQARRLEAMWHELIGKDEESVPQIQQPQAHPVELHPLSIKDRAKLDPVIAAEVNRGDWD